MRIASRFSLMIVAQMLLGTVTSIYAADPPKTPAAKTPPAAAPAKAPAPKPEPPPPIKWVPSTAYVVPKDTAPEGEGYFSIIEGQNGRIYIGTHANAVNSWLVEFDPKTKKMEKVVDIHKVIGTDIKGYGAQAKIHTRNNTGKLTGKIYFGSKQGYPDLKKGEKRTEYPGGYPMAYDPKTGKTEFWPIPVKHQGINSIMPDESRGLIYVSTCSDDRPWEHSVFLVLDTKTGKYKELIDTEHMYGFIVLDNKGRAYHPVRGGKIARYNPETQKLDLLTQLIDGQSPTPESHLADENGHPINWDASPDGKTLYCVPMSTNQLYAYDMTGDGTTITAKSLGQLIPGAKQVDCRGMCVGPKGMICAAVTSHDPRVGGQANHLVTYKPGDKAPVDHGVVEITNPDYTEFKDKDGKPLKWHAGVGKTADGHTTTKVITLGICEAVDGSIYILTLHPYSVLQVKPGFK